MPDFQLVSEFQPTGDQPEAIAQLVDGLRQGFKHQTLLGATGTGKTFTVASVVAQINRPTLVMCHNKTLAAQLYAEFKDFFPYNAVEYFVSYYDYYQPEAYVPQKDLFIEKETDINQDIERLRLSATAAVLSRRDVLIVASVSCIYGLGSPEAYGKVVLEVRQGQAIRRDILLRHLVHIHYDRNDLELRPAPSARAATRWRSCPPMSSTPSALRCGATRWSSSRSSTPPAARCSPGNPNCSSIRPSIS